jgi:hypothetical protein
MLIADSLFKNILSSALNVKLSVADVSQIQLFHLI